MQLNETERIEMLIHGSGQIQIYIVHLGADDALRMACNTYGRAIMHRKRRQAGHDRGMQTDLPGRYFAMRLHWLPSSLCFSTIAKLCKR